MEDGMNNVSVKSNTMGRTPMSKAEAKNRFEKAKESHRVLQSVLDREKARGSLVITDFRTPESVWEDIRAVAAAFGYSLPLQEGQGDELTALLHGQDGYRVMRGYLTEILDRAKDEQKAVLQARWAASDASPFLYLELVLDGQVVETARSTYDAEWIARSAGMSLHYIQLTEEERTQLLTMAERQIEPYLEVQLAWRIQSWRRSNAPFWGEVDYNVAGLIVILFIAAIVAAIIGSMLPVMLWLVGLAITAGYHLLWCPVRFRMKLKRFRREAEGDVRRESGTSPFHDEKTKEAFYNNE